MAESRRLLLTLSNAASVQLKLIAVDFPVCVYRYLETLLLLPWLWLILIPILVLHISVAAAAAIELVQPPHTHSTIRYLIYHISPGWPAF